MDNRILSLDDTRSKPRSGDSNAAAIFLDLLFGRAPADCWLLIWERAGKRSTWFTVGELDKAANFAATRTGDTYFGVSLSPENFGESRRVKADQAAGIVGVWADIDTKSEAHKSAALPHTLDQARELAGSLGLEPTISIVTGHGLQPYWLFDAPWIFADDTERQQARQLVEDFQGALRRNAEATGWKLDSTHDLARVLRVPGTTNCKVKDYPVPVRILSADGPRSWLVALGRIETFWIVKVFYGPAWFQPTSEIQAACLRAWRATAARPRLSRIPLGGWLRDM